VSSANQDRVPAVSRCSVAGDGLALEPPSPDPATDGGLVRLVVPGCQAEISEVSELGARLTEARLTHDE
jgi:hypothetical protein